MGVCFWILFHMCVQVCGGKVLPGISLTTNVKVEPVHFIKNLKGVSVSTTASTVKSGKQDEQWVDDSIYYNQYQSDSTGTETTAPDFCPPIPDVASDDACAQKTCKTDSDCAEFLRCCYNGCIYTCLLEVEPSPVLDWLVEPRRFRSGISWLIDDPPSSRSYAEICSIAPVGPDEDPLLCPHGYYCFVENSGSKKKNGKQRTRGICVKEAVDGSIEKEEIALTQSLEGMKFCTVDNVVLLEGAKIRLVDKHCRCKKGYLSCSSYTTSEDNGIVKVKKSRKSKSKSKSKSTSKDTSNAKKRRRKRRRNKSKKKNSSS